MQSDYWAETPTSECPGYIQHNRAVCGRMDAFYAAEKTNMASIQAYVESLYHGQAIGKPIPVSVPSVGDREMEFMMEDSINDAAKVARLMRGDDSGMVAYFMDRWNGELKRKSNYLGYNRKALEKRYRKGSDQKEIDRVKKLISDGEDEVSFLSKRIDWAASIL